MAGSAKMLKENPIDTLRELLQSVPVNATDGLLLVRTTASGEVIPHVLRLGLMTEGRLEAAIMPIYMEINRCRVAASHKRT